VDQSDSPGEYEVTLVTPAGERAIRVRGDEHIWDVATRNGIKLPALCHQGYCLSCAGRLEGAGEVDQADSEQYFPEDRAAGYVLLCTGRPRSDLRIRTHQQFEMRKYRTSLHLPSPYS
jgi:ferredoxin